MIIFRLAFVSLKKDTEYVPNIFRNGVNIDKQKANFSQSTFYRNPLAMSQEGNHAEEKKDGTNIFHIKIQTFYSLLNFF